MSECISYLGELQFVHCAKNRDSGEIERYRERETKKTTKEKQRNYHPNRQMHVSCFRT